MLSSQLKGDVLFDQNNRMFPFKSFTDLEDLTPHFKHRKLWTRLQENKVDFSKKPVAYYWTAYYTGENQDEGDLVDENTHFGDCLAGNAQDIRWQVWKLGKSRVRCPRVFLKLGGKYFSQTLTCRCDFTLH